MNQHANFTPGPSQLYFTVEDHVRSAFRDGIPSLSHRSKKFEAIYRECNEGLHQLLELPAGYHTFFTGSATEIWERIIQNLVAERSLHYVNGSFSKRFYEIAVQLGRRPDKEEARAGEGFRKPRVAGDVELIAVTHNETSTGVTIPPGFLSDLRASAPDALIAVDAVSSLPYPVFDYSVIDSVFFSVQKAFGMPAGLGVWLVNERCIAKAGELLSQKKSLGSYHTIPSLLEHARKNQTPETPNVLGIYVLSKVVQDFIRRGIQNIRKETEYKAALLYQTLDGHPDISAFVKEADWRSKTVIVADCGSHTAAITERLAAKRMLPGDGYGPFKTTQLRFANFPTHSREQFELLADTLASE